ncbi:MAG TPA: hypothetical protein VMW27_14260 [Thermoanaerobaculia bacterium]|nr:hypothetical protein [Thermoanaerobaculia bacterium]
MHEVLLPQFLKHRVRRRENVTGDPRSLALGTAAARAVSLGWWRSTILLGCASSPFHRERRIRMEKKSEKKKLVLNREVLRELSREEIRQAVGGEHTYTCDSCACQW